MEPMPPRRVQLVVRPEWAGMRVSSVLRYKLGMSGTVLRRIKWQEDGILLDGCRVHTNVTVQPGQVLDVLLSDLTAEQPFPATEGPLHIVYEDRDIIVVDKPAGLVVHPGPGHYGDTLGNFLLWHYAQQGERAKLHPVHRLDKGTSGLIVTAKHPFAQDRLRLQLHTGDFSRRYLALCLGTPEPAEGVIDLPIGRCEDSIIQRQVRPDGDAARTGYRVLRSSRGLSLVRLELETGRTHQIRVHMAAIGHPLAGDFLYGAENHGLIDRPALHSAELALKHPVTGEYLTWTSPLPEDMQRLL
ncbi:MAG: RluA family pseudouridine synthase [Oscillospiraceae bacterium]|nr:RluA family pseudouridine synthase [Oscillospiraceae bacterium]